jgi:uncharacterized protein YicC (UPF0701 family)
MSQLLDKTVQALRSFSQPVVLGLAALVGAEGCASRQEAPRTPNANAFSKNNNAFAPNLSAEVTKKTVDQLTSKIDEQISQNNPSYATGVLKELSSESRCDRYVDVLRHLLHKQPQMREVVFDAVAHERSARMGAKAKDLLLDFAKARPKEGLALANIIEQPTRDLILNVQVQQGYPDVAAEMRNAANAALGASR